jgi:beta-galactosidase/beta-glucuronidase
MAALVRRDRSHPSVVLWSMCNEFECEQIEPNATAKAFRK